MIKLKWSCGHCKTLHDTMEEAYNCCPAKQVWECDKCGDWTGAENDKCQNCEGGTE